jgi:hypothetical protein
MRKTEAIIRPSKLEIELIDAIRSLEEARNGLAKIGIGIALIGLLLAAIQIWSSYFRT